MRSGKACWFGLVLILGSTFGVTSVLAADASQVDVALLADRTAVVPGGSVELAVAFSIADEWHIYWRNRGEGGMEPTFKWALPAGYKVGPLRWPAPKRHIDRIGTHTFVLEGEPVLLAELSVPADAKAGDAAAIGLDVTWLVCKQKCIPGKKSLTINLPVVSDRKEGKPANADVFEMARAALPVPQSNAKYMKPIAVRANVKEVRPGQPFEVAVILEPVDHYHINSHKPLNEYLIPTDLFYDRAEGLEISRARFPKGEVKELKKFRMKLSVYTGATAIVLPIQPDNVLESKEVRVSGVVKYQACDDRTGRCYPPLAVEWALTLPVATVQTDSAIEVEPDEPASQPTSAVSVDVPDEPTEPKDSPLDVPSLLGGGSLAEKVVQQTPPSDAVDEATEPVAEEAPAATEEEPDAPESAAEAEEEPLAVIAPVGESGLQRVQRAMEGWGYIGYAVMAFIGGFILNLMPCVLPVISIKVLSFVQQAKESRLRVFLLGTTFAFGIFVSFLVIGGLIVGLGQQWGGQFQRPEVVIVLAAIVTAFALSLFGVFAIFPPRVVNELGEKVQQEGFLSAFGMGLLATVLGTACTAPFLSAVVAIAVEQPPLVGMSIFAVAGIGMAFPYVLLAAKPAWLRFVPKAGPWMKTFEQVVGFVLLGTVVWLLNPLVTQLGGDGLLLTLVFLLFVSFAVWLYGKVEYGAAVGKKVRYYGSAVVLIAGGWWVCFVVDWSSQIEWVPYTRERAAQTVEAGNTIFVDYTADWCVNCKINERWAIDTAKVRAAFDRYGVVPFKADYTDEDPKLKLEMKRFGRSGVPMYLVYPAGRWDNPILLDEVLTPSAIIRALELAGPSETTASGAISKAEG